MTMRSLLLALGAVSAIAACAKKDSDGDDCPRSDEVEPNDASDEANFLGTDEERCHKTHQPPQYEPFGSYYVDATCGSTDVEDWFEVNMLDIGGGHNVEATVTAADLTGMRLAIQGSGGLGAVEELDSTPGDGLHVEPFPIQGPADVAVLCSSSAVTAVRAYELRVDFLCDCD